MRYNLLTTATLFVAAQAVSYLPGSPNVAYQMGSLVPIQVDRMSSTKTQIPYGYYTLDYCQPAIVESESENLGQILKGELIQNTPYMVKMQEEEICSVLCTKTLNNETLSKFKNVIDDEYFVTILADALPAALRIHGSGSSEGMLLVSGYPVGVKEPSSADAKAANAKSAKPAQHFLINHLDMTIKYHETPEGSRVVGFEVAPRSLDQSKPADNGKVGKQSCDLLGGPLDLDTKKVGDEIMFTYSVTFIPSAVSWATRWDAYLNASMDNTQIHWVSIVNAFVIVLMLSAMVATIFLRTLIRSIARYNSPEDIEDAQDETGWKLVHGDVFRRPNFSKLLATCVGTGVQVLIMTIVTLMFAVFGFLSPANRGSLIQAMLVTFALMGAPAGYVSARFTKLFQGEETHRSVIVMLWTAFQYSGVCYVVFLLLNVILWWKGSSGAVPFKSLFLIVLLWFGLSVPLVFVGSLLGYRRNMIALPVRTNSIPRHIPPTPWFLHPILVSLAGGLLPFGACFTELSFIITSVWQHKFYYLFGFLTLVVLILIITCAETSIVFTYFQLTREDYRWWWRSYWASASASIYLMLLSVLFFVNRLEITRFGSILLYFGYSFLMAYTFFLFTGAVGFLSTFWFLRLIYGAVKVD